MSVIARNSRWKREHMTKIFVQIHDFAVFCQFDVKNEPAGLRPDRTNFEPGRTGPDGKNPSGSNSNLFVTQS